METELVDHCEDSDDELRCGSIYIFELNTGPGLETSRRRNHALGLREYTPTVDSRWT